MQTSPIMCNSSIAKEKCSIDPNPKIYVKIRKKGHDYSCIQVTDY